MEYTTNYHLPQWVKEDRIMMDDFNAAMASIETGLTAADKARSLAEDMSRDLYRQTVFGRVHHCPGGLSDAMWVNPLASLEDAGGEGHGWDGRYGVYHGDGGLPTMAGIMALGPKEEAIANTNNSSAPNYSERAAVTFTSDGYGTLSQARLILRRGHADGGMMDYTITMTRLDTGEVVGTSQVFSMESTDQYTFFWKTLNFPLETHVSYRLEMVLSNLRNFWGWAGFGLASTEYASDEDALRFTARAAEPTIVKTVTPPDWATGAVGIVRWKGDGAISLAINGQPVSDARTRDNLNALGEDCKETEFPLDEFPQSPFELMLTMEKGEGDLDVYDYGLIWR